MSLNIYTQICGLVITLVIFAFNLLQRKMKIRKEFCFLRCIIITLVVLGFDIFATILNTYQPESGLTVYINRIYLLSTICTVACVFLYILNEAYSRRIYRIVSIVTLLAYLALVICIMNPNITTNIVTCEANGTIIYTTGSATLTTYIVSFIGIVAIMLISIFSEKAIGSKQATAIRIWMVLWSLFAITQYYFKQFLIASFALSLGIMILYMNIQALDNPNDQKTGLFNWNGYLQYVKERKKELRPCEIVFLKATDSINIIDEKTLNTSLQAFNECLKKRKDMLSFSFQKEYLIVLRNIPIASFIEFLNQERENHPIIANYYYPLYLKDTTKLQSQNDLPSLIELASLNINKSESDYITIDTTILQDYNKNIETENLIEQAIKNDWIEVFYQPIYSMKEQCFTSAEALVRIHNGDGNLIPPGVFIPVAEANGRIHKLDEIVFEKVCNFVASHDMEALGLKYIEVNLSVAQLCDESFSQKYSSIMRKLKVKPQYINLEITESAELGKRSALKKNMSNLINYGVSFSLDDYGTGYSNLNYVLDMPIQIVKFDKQMIDAYFRDEKAKRLMEYSARMFKSLHLEIVAEGVEKAFQIEELKDLNVDYIQGYYYSKPISMDMFIEFLKEKNK